MVEMGTPQVEVCRLYDISKATLYGWLKIYKGKRIAPEGTFPPSWLKEAENDIPEPKVEKVEEGKEVRFVYDPGPDRLRSVTIDDVKKKYPIGWESVWKRLLKRPSRY